jgi:predicted phosphodiesterase
MKEDKKDLPRRRFISKLSTAGALGLVGSILPVDVMAAASVTEDSSNVALEGHAFLTKPYLQVPSSDSMTIRWITNLLCHSWVEYGQGANLDMKAQNITDGLVDAHNRINAVTLENLKPDTVYNYRVCSKAINSFQPYSIKYGETITSDVYSFTTPKENPTAVSWLIMNDIHDRPKSIGHLMNINGNDSFDYVFFNGDMFDYQENEKQIIDHMITPCTDSFASTKPFLFVRGNHETRGKYARELKNYFSTKDDKGYYAYQWGPVFNIVLDSGEDKLDTHPVYGGIVDFDNYRIEQAKWLEEVMKTKAFRKAKYRVVMMHIPYYYPKYEEDGHGTIHCRDLFSPLFDKYKVDLMVSGHTHRYGVHPPTEEHSYPIVIGGGPQDGNRTLIKVKADEKNLKVTMLKDDGTEVGEYLVQAKG